MNDDTRQLIVKLLLDEYVSAYLNLAGTKAQYDCSGFGWYRDELRLSMDSAAERLGRATEALKDMNEPIPDMGY